VTRPIVDSQPGLVDIGSQVHRPYNEAAFRYFLAVERKRAEHTRRPLLLIMIRTRKQSRTRLRREPEVARAVLGVLGACVREVDLVGWYRDGLIAAALLPLNDTASHNTRQAVVARITDVLQHSLAYKSAHFQVRAIELTRERRM
jgi:hypothetical protein